MSKTDPNALNALPCLKPTPMPFEEAVPPVRNPVSPVRRRIRLEESRVVWIREMGQHPVELGPVADGRLLVNAVLSTGLNRFVAVHPAVFGIVGRPDIDIGPSIGDDLGILWKTVEYGLDLGSAFLEHAGIGPLVQQHRLVAQGSYMGSGNQPRLTMTGRTRIVLQASPFVFLCLKSLYASRNVSGPIG